MIRVLVVDDNQEFRAAVRDLLEGDLQIRVVGEACDGLQAISLTAHLQPDLILMDIAMPLMNGLEATSAIRERWPQVIVILVTAIPSNSYQQISDRCGANAFLPKEEMGSRLIPTMHRLACATLPVWRKFFPKLIKAGSSFRPPPAGASAESAAACIRVP